MIISNKQHALDYLGINENLDKALRYLHDTDFSQLEDGLHQIDGMDVRVNIRHMTTKPSCEAKLEAHDAFADIQMVFNGTENLLVCFRDDKLTLTEARPESDVYFYEGASSAVSLCADQFIIVFPDDVHAPGVCCDEPSLIRKGVFKVKLS